MPPSTKTPQDEPMLLQPFHETAGTIKKGPIPDPIPIHDLSKIFAYDTALTELYGTENELGWLSWKAAVQNHQITLILTCRSIYIC